MLATLAYPLEMKMTDHAPRYLEFFQLYASQQRKIRERALRLQKSAQALVHAVREALGLPDYFELPDGETSPWVQLYDVPQENVFKPSGWLDLKTWSDAGDLHFGIGVALSVQEKTFPKNYFVATYSATEQQGRVLFQEMWEGGQVRITHEKDGYAEAAEGLLSALKTHLELSPASMANNRPGRIGFI